MIEPHSLPLLPRQLHRPPLAAPDLHPDAQRPQYGVVLLLGPDVRERPPVLHLEVVVLRQRAEGLPGDDVLRHLLDGLRHEVAVLPPEGRAEHAVGGGRAREAHAVEAVAPFGDRGVVHSVVRGGWADVVFGFAARIPVRFRRSSLRRVKRLDLVPAVRRGGGAVIYRRAVRIPVRLRRSSLRRVKRLDLVPQHVRVGDHPDQAPAFLQRARHVAQHAARLGLGLERVVHAEHHGHDVEAAATPSRAPAATGADVPVDADLPDQRDVSDPLAVPVGGVELALEDPRVSAAPAAHLGVSGPRLLDGHFCRVNPHV